MQERLVLNKPAMAACGFRKTGYVTGYKIIKFREISIKNATLDGILPVQRLSNAQEIIVKL